jgi:hypothetical protein
LQRRNQPEFDDERWSLKAIKSPLFQTRDRLLTERDLWDVNLEILGFAIILILHFRLEAANGLLARLFELGYKAEPVQELTLELLVLFPWETG